MATHSEGVPAVLEDTLEGFPDLIPALLDRLARAENEAARVMLPSVLHASFEQNVPRALDTCRRLVADGGAVGVRAVAQALQKHIPDPSVQEAGALALARALSNHTDPVVRAGVLGMAVSMLHTSKDTALELLTSVPFGETGSVPYRLWWAFTMDGVLSWEQLTDTQRAFSWPS